MILIRRIKDMVVIQGNFEEKNEGQSKPNMYKGEDIDYYIFG